MLNGYAGKILKVNLSSGDISQENLDESIVRQYIGGSGLGARILYDETTAHTDPLGQDNVLIFATGPFTGTPVFNSDRFEVIARSPLTGIYAESDCGGHWAEQFKRCGYDALVIMGKARTLVYLLVSEQQTKINDARYLWGKDTFETWNILTQQAGPQAQVVCIGPAGEKLVRFASVMADGKHGRAAGRCGVGAVMGSKNLKAIIAQGRLKTPIARETDLKAYLKELRPKITADSKVPQEFGTAGWLLDSAKVGDLPIRNWYQGEWKGSPKISGQTMAKTILTKRFACGRCFIACGRVVQVTQGPFKQKEEAGGPEYETLAMLGSNCLVDDLSAIARANELCNRYGLDTISTGAVIAFAMEAYERGLITKEDTDGLELVWGGTEALPFLNEMLNQYYEYRGWDEFGRPRKEKLQQLDLE